MNNITPARLAAMVSRRAKGSEEALDEVNQLLYELGEQDLRKRVLAVLRTVQELTREVDDWSRETQLAHLTATCPECGGRFDPAVGHKCWRTGVEIAPIGTVEDGSSSGQEASEDPRPQPEAEEPPQAPLPHICANLACSYGVRRLGAFCEECSGTGQEAVPGPRYLAHFDPQAWVDDYAMAVDPQGPQEWDCTDTINRMCDSLPDGRGAFLRSDIEKATHGGDEWLGAAARGIGVFGTMRYLKADPATPAWVRAWSGPFTITVTRKED